MCKTFKVELLPNKRVLFQTLDKSLGSHHHHTFRLLRYNALNSKYLNCQ